MENNKLSSFMSPKAGMAFVVLVVTSLITSILTFVTPGSKGSGFGFGLLFIILIISLILSSFALYLSTRLVKVPEGSFARAMVFNSGTILVLGILASLLILVGLSVVLVFIINIIILIILIRWYYKVSIMRSLGIVLIDFIISGIMAFILFIVMTALGLGLFTALLFNSQKGTENTGLQNTENYFMDEQSTNDTQESTESVSSTPGQSSSVTATDKQSVINAYFAFGKILESKNSADYISYLKKVYPEKSKEFDTDPDFMGDLSPEMGLVYIFSGFDSLTSKDFQSAGTTWTKKGDSINVEVAKTGSASIDTYHLDFKNQGGIWYVDVAK